MNPTPSWSVSPVDSRSLSSFAATLIASFASLLLSCVIAAVPNVAMAQAAKQEPAPLRPEDGEVVLPCAEGWRAHMVFDAGVGVWTVVAAKVHEQYGCPELIALDDRGRCTVLRSYSGKWTPESTITDGKWLAPTAVGSLHQAARTRSVYVGGASGRLWQLRPRTGGVFDCRVLAEWNGEEVHTVVLGDIDTTTPGAELLVFLASGRVFRVDSRSAEDSDFDVRELESVPGRVREALLVKTGDGRTNVLAVSRAGFLASLHLEGAKLATRFLAREPMGLGRIASTMRGDELVLYVTRDDGVILRFAGDRDAILTGELDLTREIIYAGPQGPRGIACGHFHEDPAVESIAIFGYSKCVELLSREGEGPWSVTTIFEEIDKGHWLSTCEVDGRNGTDELVASGYAGRVVLLSRPPGFGLPSHVPSVPSATTMSRAPAGGSGVGGPAPLRIGLRARDGVGKQLSPLSYTGGFATKSMLYETLVERDQNGRVGPGLAERWEISDDGRRFDFVLREDARFHDGTLVTAEDVRMHMRRCLGLPEHDWLAANRLVDDVTVVSSTCVRFELVEPHALLESLCAINPCAIAAPSSRDREGRFIRPVGSGPYRFVEDINGRSWRVASASSGQELEVVAFARRGPEPIAALRSGAIDVFVGGWDEDLPALDVDELCHDTKFSVQTAPGSSVVVLDYRGEGATAHRDVRSAIEGAIDREALIAGIEGGRADPTDLLMAPSLSWWPRNDEPIRPADAGAVARLEETITVRPGRLARTERVASAVVLRLRRAGFRAVLAPREEADADVTVNVTLGLPYDPLDAIRTRFGNERGRWAASQPELARLVTAALREPREEQRLGVYRAIQAYVREHVLVTPLYVPKRIALYRRGISGISLGPDLYHVDLSTLRVDLEQR
ncbi:MAG: hypothetical protein H6833_06745 [Planctomycetes bacterium]|nr:hypothetical protein [Planctomycetota bacterium]